MIHETIFENIDKIVDYLNNQGWNLSITNTMVNYLRK